MALLTTANLLLEVKLRDCLSKLRPYISYTSHSGLSSAGEFLVCLLNAMINNYSCLGFAFHTKMSTTTDVQNIARTMSCRLHSASTKSVTFTTLRTAIRTRTPGYRTILTILRWKVTRSSSENYSHPLLLVADNVYFDWLVGWLVGWLVDWLIDWLIV